MCAEAQQDQAEYVRGFIRQTRLKIREKIQCICPFDKLFQAEFRFL